MNPSRFAALAVLAGLVCSTASCSRAAAVCETICECEHCNDQAKTEQCNQLGTAEDVAHAYGCVDSWEVYATCFETRGTCDKDMARFTVEDGMNQNRCQDEVDALNTCVEKASNHEGIRSPVK